MKAIILMFDSLNRHMLPPYADTFVNAPNFERLARHTVTFEKFFAGSMPCMPARREMHTGRYNFLHRSWGPLEPFDDSMPERLKLAGIHAHLATDHPHYWEDGGGTYHTRYSTFELIRGQEADPWKGVVSSNVSGRPESKRMFRQDEVNRRYMATEAEHSQTLTVDAGIHFLDVNAQSDDWMLQIELFDPHEPFFAHEKYRDIYPDDWTGPVFDWPGYEKVSEPDEQVEHARRQYAALVSMCDFSLGRVLDAMDEKGLWDDTLLIVNTDHGFLLGEHGWWAKSVQPWYNELVHIPMFVWDPRTREAGSRREDLAQTIDIAPTVLSYFGLEVTSDNQGRDLCEPTTAPRDAALFGIFGGHVNVTDGRYVYMRASKTRQNGPIEEFTLMPTHMRRRYSPEELAEWEPAPAFEFTKGLRTMRIEDQAPHFNSWLHGSMMFDTETDPQQLNPLIDDEIERRMIALLRDLMVMNDAPRSQFERLGIPSSGPITDEHLSLRADEGRAAQLRERLPDLSAHPSRAMLDIPVAELLMRADTTAVLDRHVPWLTNTELVSAPPTLSLFGLARNAAVTAAELTALANDLTPLVDSWGDASA